MDEVMMIVMMRLKWKRSYKQGVSIADHVIGIRLGKGKELSEVIGWKEKE